MGLFDALTNNASEIPAAQAQEELGPLLIEGETVLKAYRLVRDLIAFTNCRIITVDKQGMTGKKQHVRTIPYKHIRGFSKITAGFLDLDAELEIYVAGSEVPLKFEFRDLLISTKRIKS